jgi:hypothetical protein
MYQFYPLRIWGITLKFLCILWQYMLNSFNWKFNYHIKKYNLAIFDTQRGNNSETTQNICQNQNGFKIICRIFFLIPHVVLLKFYVSILSIKNMYMRYYFKISMYNINHFDFEKLSFHSFSYLFVQNYHITFFI